MRVQMDIAYNQDAAERFRIRTVPSVFYIKGRHVVEYSGAADTAQARSCLSPPPPPGGSGMHCICLQYAGRTWTVQTTPLAPAAAALPCKAPAMPVASTVAHSLVGRPAAASACMRTLSLARTPSSHRLGAGPDVPRRAISRRGEAKGALASESVQQTESEHFSAAHVRPRRYTSTGRPARALATLRG